MKKGTNLLALVLALTTSLTFGLLLILISEYLLNINLIAEGMPRNIYLASLVGLGSISYIGIKRALEGNEEERKEDAIIAKLIDDVSILKNEVKEVKERISKIESKKEEEKSKADKIEGKGRKKVSKSLEVKESVNKVNKKIAKQEKKKEVYEDEIIKSAHELLLVIKSFKDKVRQKEAIKR
jgi:hypothetical protein